MSENTWAEILQGAQRGIPVEPAAPPQDIFKGNQVDGGWAQVVAAGSMVASTVLAVPQKPIEIACNGQINQRSKNDEFLDLQEMLFSENGNVAIWELASYREGVAAGRQGEDVDKVLEALLKRIPLGDDPTFVAQCRTAFLRGVRIGQKVKSGVGEKVIDRLAEEISAQL